jgi:hypothetical protein
VVVDSLKRIPLGALVIVVGTIAAIGWITVGGTTALVISMIAGALVALRGTLGDDANKRLE